MTNNTNNKTYIVQYNIIDTNHDSVIYEVNSGSTSGNAVCALTKYNNEKSKPTLVITLGDYSLYFFANDVK